MQESQPKPSRRGFVFGAATAGAAAAAVVALPKVQEAVQAAAPELKQPPDNGGGYQLTDHVKHYYRTTLV